MRTAKVTLVGNNNDVIAQTTDGDAWVDAAGKPYGLVVGGMLSLVAEQGGTHHLDVDGAGYENVQVCVRWTEGRGTT